MKIEFKQECIERTICGQVLTFYPCRVSMIHKLRAAGGPLVQAVMRMTAPPLDPGGSKNEDMVDTQSGSRIVRSETMPIPLAVLEAQANERLDSAQSVLDALLSPTAIELVKDLLADSLRLSTAQREDMDNWPVPALASSLPAWAEAQANIPFVQQARDLLDQVRAAAQARVEALKRSSTTEKSGSDSSIPSTSSPEEATPSPTSTT